VQQAFPSVKYKRFLYLKGGRRFACRWLKVHLMGESKNLQRKGGDVLSNAEEKNPWSTL
jgi:hypothetical protein